MKYQLNDFEPGMYVRYIPNHAHGDIKHKDCENGIVKAVNDMYVQVNYFYNGYLKPTAQSTYARDLIIMDTMWAKPKESQ